MSLEVVTLCTGNAARSVMAGVMLAQLAEAEGLDLKIATAGTHVIDGQPMGMRTKQAIVAIGELDTTGLGLHRSHQLDEPDCARADLIVAMEADHVRYVRRRHPEVADRTATLHRLVRTLDSREVPFLERLDALGLAEVDLVGDVDVIDPAGGDQALYDEVAEEIWGLCQALVVLMA